MNGNIKIANLFGIPFYIAAPLSTFDINCATGNDIIIEDREEEEVLYMTGLNESNELSKVLICNQGSKALNPAFDVTPASFITGIITEKGIIKANEHDIKNLF